MAITEDAIVPSIDYSIRLNIYEGPLDLLLFLIRKNEIDIYDIPIENVTRQYLDVIYSMEKLNLEVAGDFFVMAATLMHIKSRMLLPKNEQIIETENEDEVDPRWELVQQLIEYKKFKDAARDLGDVITEANNYLTRGSPESDGERILRPLKSADKIELWNLFNQVLRRLAERITYGEIHDETVTVAERMEFIIELLRTTPEFLFSELFINREYNLTFLIATFLAILELARMRTIEINQEIAFTDIRCRLNPED